MFVLESSFALTMIHSEIVTCLFALSGSLNTGISLLQFTEHNLGESVLICDASSQ